MLFENPKKLKNMIKKTLLIMMLVAFFVPMAVQAQEKGTTDMWDFVTSFTCSTGRQHGIVYDGEHIYTSAWGKSSTVLYMFYKYDLEGNLLDQFDVAGMADDTDYLRDMTYDGTYFYGCDSHSGKIWCVDLHNKTLVNANAINTSLDDLGHCTYDPVYDAFWVGERATGTSPNLMLNLKLVNRSGQVIKTATPQSLGGHTVHGTGYFTDENDVAHIYLFAVEGFTAHVFDYNIDTDSMTSNYIFDFSVTPGWGFACSAGGAYIGECNGSIYFFGDVDKSPNLIGIYALGEYTPPVPVAPEGDIYEDFNDGIIHWNLIDADGDGYNWEMRYNWATPENPYSLTSASVDISEVPLFPDNYLVTPWMLDCEQIVFSANVQDITHPEEHLAVAVSTTSGTDPDAFEIVWETTMTAKQTGNWYDFSVDLRAYQGQDIYVAILHTNCTNQFMVNIDDIILYRVFNPSWSVNEGSAVSCNVYPNPAVDLVWVESPLRVESYELYTVTGALVLRHEVDANSFGVDLSTLPAGAYLLRMRSEGMTETRRIVKR